jgi:hypothetical protein
LSLVLSSHSALAIDANLESCSTQNFPFVSLTINVRQGGLRITDLTRDDFRCFENGAPQTDQFVLIPPQPGGTRLADIVFLVDASGSMNSYWQAVRTSLTDFAAGLALSDIDFRLGLVRFGRSGDDPPKLFNEGRLTDDAELFQSLVSEPGGLNFPVGTKQELAFTALRLAVETFDFRPFAQKIFILITDQESIDRDQKAAVVDLLVAHEVTVHTAAPCFSNEAHADYCDEETSVRAATGGKTLDITGPYDAIFDTVGRLPVDDYIIHYRSSNPAFDATNRFVHCLLLDPPEAEVECTYVPGAAPHIELTPETARMNKFPVVVGSSPVIGAIVVDRVAPFVSAVDLFFRTSGSGAVYESVPMVPVGDDVYKGALRSVTFPGVDFYIQATDGEITSFLPSLQPAALPFQIAVGPNVVPEIVHDPVTRAPAGLDLPIRAEVTDSTNFLANVKLFWRHAGELRYTALDMLKIGGDVYEAIIPGGDTTVDIEYYIRAVDDLGVGSTSAAADAPFRITFTCHSDAECDDGNACNGVARCDEEAGRCVAGTAPAAVIVAMGGSITAGFQSSVLVESLQRQSAPALLAAQACIPFTLPLIAEGGHTIDGHDRPFNLSSATQDLTDESLSSLGGRINPENQPFNLAVPGATLKQVSSTRQSRRNPLFELVLQGPGFDKSLAATKKERRIYRKGSQLSQAIQLAPSLILLAVGTDDVLQPTLRGKVRRLPKEGAFKGGFERLVQKLRSKTTADIVVANIPDVTTFPHMLPVGAVVGELPFSAFAECPCPADQARCDITDHLERSIVPVAVRGGKGSHPDGSVVPYQRLNRQLEREALCAAPFVGTEDAFRRTEVLDPKELSAIRQRIGVLNGAIAEVAAAQNLVLVDMHGLVAGVQDKSFTGGFFSLDGIYPSSAGQRQLANAFIDAVNAEIAARGRFGGLSTPIASIGEAAPVSQPE